MIIDFYNRNGGGGGTADLSGVVASADLSGTTLSLENNSGTTIDSVELSGLTADYYTKSEIDAGTSAITETLTGLTETVQTTYAIATGNTESIGTLGTAVSGNTDAISGLDTRVSANTQNINTLSASTSANTENINALGIQVSANTQAIAEISGHTGGDSTKLEPVNALPTSAETGSVFATAFPQSWGQYDGSALQEIRVHKVGESIAVSWDMPIEGFWAQMDWNENDGITMSGGWDWVKDENNVWHPNSSYDASEQPSAVYEDGDYIYIKIVPSGVVFVSAYDMEKMEMLIPATNSLYQANSQSGATTIYKEYAKKDDVAEVQTYAEGVNTLAQSAYTYADNVNTRLDNFSATKLGAIEERPKLIEKGTVLSVVNSATTGVYLAGDSGNTGGWEWSSYTGEAGYKAYRSNQGRMGLNLTVQDVDGITRFYWDWQNSVWNTGQTGGESWTITYTDNNTVFTAVSSPNNVTASGYADNGYVYVFLSNPSDGDYGGDGASEVGVPEVASDYNNFVVSPTANKIVSMSAADYAQITPDSSTIYIII